MANSRIVKYSENDIVIREGEVSLALYKIIEGKAEICVGHGTDHETLIGIIGEKSCFGEQGLLLGEPSVYTVIAYSDLYVLCVTEDELDNFIRENHTNVIDIMRNMANTMRTMRLQINLLLKEIEAGHKPEEKTISDARKAMLGCGVYKSIQEAVDKMER